MRTLSNVEMNAVGGGNHPEDQSVHTTEVIVYQPSAWQIFAVNFAQFMVDVSFNLLLNALISDDYDYYYVDEYYIYEY